MEEMFHRRQASLKKLAAKQTRPVQPVAPRPEVLTKSPCPSPGICRHCWSLPFPSRPSPGASTHFENKVLLAHGPLIHSVSRVLNGCSKEYVPMALECLLPLRDFPGPCAPLQSPPDPSVRAVAKRVPSHSSDPSPSASTPLSPRRSSGRHTAPRRPLTPVGPQDRFLSGPGSLACSSPLFSLGNPHPSVGCLLLSELKSILGTPGGPASLPPAVRCDVTPSPPTSLQTRRPEGFREPQSRGRRAPERGLPEGQGEVAQALCQPLPHSQHPGSAHQALHEALLPLLASCGD